MPLSEPFETFPAAGFSYEMIKQMSANRVFNKPSPPGVILSNLIKRLAHYGIDQAVIPYNKLRAGAAFCQLALSEKFKT